MPEVMPTTLPKNLPSMDAVTKKQNVGKIDQFLGTAQETRVGVSLQNRHKKLKTCHSEELSFSVFFLFFPCFAFSCF